MDESSDLVKVCSGIRGQAFEDLHVLNESLTGSFDLSLVGAVLPTRAESGVNQAVSPGRVKPCRIGVWAGNLTTSDKAGDKVFSGSGSAVQEEKKNLQVPEPRGLEQFSS